MARPVESFRLSRRAALAVGTGALVAPRIASAQAWPTRPVTVIVGFPAGGQTDFAARVTQPGISTALGQPMVIDNRGGAGGNIGMEAAFRARPDGYTLLAGNNNHMTINPHVYSNINFNTLQFVPIGMLLQSSLILCVHPSIPATNFAEFQTWVKSQPRGVDYGTGGAGGLVHVAMELLRSRMGNPPMEPVPYRGSAPAMTDLIANRISTMFDGASVVAPYLRANQLRGIMVTGAQRIPAFPNIPTAAEQGLQDFTFTAWIGLFGPPGTPAEVVQRCNAAVNAATSDPATRERITNLGDEPGGGTPEALGEQFRNDHRRWGEVARAANIRVE